jgi:sulfatase modifying factor 1
MTDTQRLPLAYSSAIRVWFHFTVFRKRTLFHWFLLIFALSVVFYPAPAIHAQEKKVLNSLGMEFVLIPAGMFIMGSPLDEAYRNLSEVQHPVTITQPFYMQTTEVTVGQWRSVMGRRFLARKKGSVDMPVVKVSWYDCKKFIRKLNRMTGDLYMLPTEAQWEYAARAGSVTPYFWGSQIDCSRAMFANNPMKYDACVAGHRSSGIGPGRPGRVKRYPPMPGGCMTCTAMSGSGARTSLVTTGRYRWLIRARPNRVKTVFDAEAAGSVPDIRAAAPIAPMATP